MENKIDGSEIIKVTDLIDELKRYNPNADVTLTFSEDITLSYICKDIDGNELMPSDTMQVFIEPTDKVNDYE